MVQLMPLPSQNPIISGLISDWFYLSGAGLPRLSWKRGHQMGVVVVVVVVVGISSLIPLVLSHCWQGFGSHPAYRNLVIFPKGSLLEQVEERSQGNWLTQVDLEGSH